MSKQPAGTRRITLRDLAAGLGLSATAVSMALRNHVRIAPATRKRVQKYAAACGYTPDPQVMKLMLHLRSSRIVKTQAALCGLTDWPTGPNDNAYITPLVEAAKRRAREQGYAFEKIDIRDYAKTAGGLDRVLRARGVEGVVLLTLKEPGSLEGLLDWSRFSVITTSYSVLSPSCHRVVPHHFENSLRAYRMLTERGYRRIGLVLPPSVDVRVHHCYSAAITWHHRFGGGEAVNPYIEPDQSVDAIWAWISREEPDVVAGQWPVGLHARLKAAGVRVPRDLGLVWLHGHDDPSVTQIDVLPGEIGSTAIDTLAGMVLRGEKGLPATSKVTMLEGKWFEGHTVLKRR